MIAALLLTLVLAPQAPASTTDPVIVTRLASPEKALQIETTLPASLDAAWAAFTTEEGLKTWLWRDARVDFRPGGDWLVLYPGGKTGGGTILSISPKRRVTIAALAPEQFPAVRDERTRAIFDFVEIAPGQTKVTLTQTGWRPGAEWDQAYEYLAKGNATLLRQLYQRFASGPIDWAKR
jgi:uncharacterized protein YndB with AHSA1/START domain